MSIDYNKETKTLILTSPEDLEAKGRLEQHVSAEHIVFEKDITIIPGHVNGLLSKFKNLESIRGDGVLNVGSNAFSYCEKLVTVTLPKATTIGENAFYICSQLTKVNIPNVTTIGEKAFYCCSQLTEVNIPNVTTIEENTFASCRRLASIVAPKTTKIKREAFRGCTSLVKAEFSPTISDIDPSAFERSSFALGDKKNRSLSRQQNRLLIRKQEY